MSGDRPAELLGWLDAPRADLGLRFARDAGGWDEQSYDELAARAHAAGVQVAESARPTGVISLLLPTGAEFLAAFYGTLLAGRTASPIAPPEAFRSLERYGEHVVGLLRAAQPGLLVTTPELAAVASPALRRAGLDVPTLCLDADPGERGTLREPLADLALLQFTSGSTAAPKGVRVPPATLAATVAGAADVLGVRPDGHVAGWVPHYHDMGLIGFLLAGVGRQARLSSLRPEVFVRQPLRYLECLGRDGATSTTSPGFGYGYAARRLTAADLRGLDFAGWTHAGVGGDRVSAAPLRHFLALAAPFGFDAASFVVGYGLAEATLQVSAWSAPSVVTAIRVRPGELALGRRVRGGRAALPAVEGDGHDWLVSSGQPLGGTAIRIVGDDGRELPERHLGEVAVEGPTVAAGYLGDAAESATRFAGGTLFTGDAGFLAAGDLYVLGRMGDSVDLRGRLVHLEDVEARLAEIGALRPGRYVTIAGPDRVVLLVEGEAGAWTGDARAVLVELCGTDAEIEIRLAPPGTIKRTSSGKPQRRELWQDLLAGRLPGAPADAPAADTFDERLAGIRDLIAEGEPRAARIAAARLADELGDDPRIRRVQADALAADGLWSRAAAVYEQLLAAAGDGDAADLRLALARTRVEEGEPELALQALEGLRRDPPVLELHARALTCSGRLRAAARVHERLAAADPAAVPGLVRALARAGDHARARELLRSADATSALRDAAREARAWRDGGAALDDWCATFGPRGGIASEAARLLLRERTEAGDPLGAVRRYLRLAPVTRGGLHRPMADAVAGAALAPGGAPALREVLATATASAAAWSSIISALLRMSAFDAARELLDALPATPDAERLRERLGPGLAGLPSDAGLPEALRAGNPRARPVTVLRHRGARSVAVVVGAATARTLYPQLAARGTDLVCVTGGRIVDAGVAGLAADWPGTVAAIRALAQRPGPRNMVCIGASMAGYTAVRLAVDLRAASALVFAPPTDLGAEAFAADGRGPALRARLAHTAPERRIPLRDVLAAADAPPRVLAWYPEHGAVDRFHAERLDGAPGTTVRYLPGGARHQVLLDMLDADVLDRALDEALPA